jgi:hypothetical protein
MTYWPSNASMWQKIEDSDRLSGKYASRRLSRRFRCPTHLMMAWLDEYADGTMMHTGGVGRRRTMMPLQSLPQAHTANPSGTRLTHHGQHRHKLEQVQSMEAFPP